MQDTGTIAAARSFLALLNQGAPPSSRALLRALDELAAARGEQRRSADSRQTPLSGFAASSELLPLRVSDHAPFTSPGLVTWRKKSF